MTYPGRFLCRYWRILIVVGALAAAFRFSGYAPEHVVSLAGNCPLALMKDGKTLIVGSAGKPIGWGFRGQVVGPIRFVDVTNGEAIQPALEIKDYWAATRQPPFQVGLWEWTTITSATLSDDQRRLIVRCDYGGSNSHFAVYDLSTYEILVERAITHTDIHDPPTAQLSGDGRLLAWSAIKVENGSEDEDGSIIVWDLDEHKERFRVPERSRSAGFQFSPDSKLLVAHVRPGQCQVIDATSGEVLHSAEFPNYYIHGPPIFSTDSKYVALNCMTGQGSRIIDVSSGRQCFQFMGCSPQFLPGLLLGVTDSHLPVTIEPNNFFVPAISVWNCGDWTEKRSFVYRLGNSPLTGTVIPQYFSLSRGNQGHGNEFAVLYATYNGWWTGSSMTSKWVVALFKFGCHAFEVPDKVVS